LAGTKLARFVLSPPRAELHRRIGLRFDQMICAGAMDEASRLKDIDRTLPAAKILGLRELQLVLDGNSTLETAGSAAKIATRQYAKRQLTWFRHRMADWVWIEAQDLNEVTARMLEEIRRSE
jgi:tRNA dimethylallyltransferase